MAKKKSKLTFAKILKSGKSVELPEGIHENVYLESVEKGELTNSFGTENKKHLYIKFNKVGKDGNVEGHFTLSFFKIDTDRDSALYNLSTFLKRIKEVALLFYTEDQFYKKFDPLALLLDEEEDAADVQDEFLYDNIKDKRFEHVSNISKIEMAAAQLAEKILEKKTGEDGEPLRILLDKNPKTDYVEIPRFSEFVEPMKVAKKVSVLYNAKK